MIRSIAPILPCSPLNLSQSSMADSRIRRAQIRPSGQIVWVSVGKQLRDQACSEANSRK
jgi:hypothetical protein